MPDALVTGATGFVGGALLRRLVAEGREVRALARTPARLPELEAAGAEPVLGDLLDAPSLERAGRGCRVVFHAAGLNAVCPRRPKNLERVNVDGTVALIRACAAAGVRRVVYTSSAAAIGEPAGVVGDEQTRHRGRYLTAYERSKHLAEVAAFAEAARLGVDLVAVNPSSVQGPGRTGGSARFLLHALRPGVRLAVRTTVSLVYVGDCVSAHLLAERRSTPGRRYLVSGWTATTAEVLSTLERVIGRPIPVWWLPRWMLRPAGAVAGAFGAIARRDRPFCSEAARAILHGHAFDGTRSESDLGLRYTPPDVWLAETVAWYRERGRVE